MGINIVPANSDDLVKISKDKEYLTMGVWPEKTSIKAIGNVLVVNFAPVVSYEIEETEDIFRVQAKSNKKKRSICVLFI